MPPGGGGGGVQHPLPMTCTHTRSDSGKEATNTCKNGDKGSNRNFCAAVPEGLVVQLCVNYFMPAQCTCHENDKMQLKVDPENTENFTSLQIYLFGFFQVRSSH